MLCVTVPKRRRGAEGAGDPHAHWEMTNNYRFTEFISLGQSMWTRKTMERGEMMCSLVSCHRRRRKCMQIPRAEELSWVVGFIFAKKII